MENEECGCPGDNSVTIGVESVLMGKFTEKEFESKGEAVLQANFAALQAGWEYAGNQWPELRDAYKMNGGDGIQRLYMIGNEAISQGAIDAGVRFMAAYPITPASELWKSWWSNCQNWAAPWCRQKMKLRLHDGYRRQLCRCQGFYIHFGTGIILDGRSNRFGRHDGNPSGSD